MDAVWFKPSTWMCLLSGHRICLRNSEPNCSAWAHIKRVLVSSLNIIATKFTLFCVFNHLCAFLMMLSSKRFIMSGSAYRKNRHIIHEIGEVWRISSGAEIRDNQCATKTGMKSMVCHQCFTVKYVHGWQIGLIFGSFKIVYATIMHSSRMSTDRFNGHL